MNNHLHEYYNQRAKEYEKIYSKPERQSALKEASEILQNIFSEKNVYEIACGTGYWTEIIARTASSVIAMDINESVLEIAKKKKYSRATVSFKVEDIFNRNFKFEYDHLFAGFIWSHIKIEEITDFIRQMEALVKPGGTIVIMDNLFVEGSSTAITKIDPAGNTYQTRKLENGSTHLVLKNFPTKNFLLNELNILEDNIKYFDLTYFWILEYQRPLR